MEIQPEKQNLDQTFSNTVYHIDFYQRSYKWGEEPVQRLFDDILYEFEESWKKNPDLDPNRANIDANYPWGAEEILQEIRKTTSKPVKFVFNTHYHHDHTFGNAIFVDAGATIVSTAKTAEEMRSLGQYEWDHGSGYSGRNMKGYRREFPSLLFNDTIVFDDSIHRVELIRMGPAHTGGDGVAFLPKEKILVTGDLFINGNPWGNNVADADADYDKWLDVLETMAGWNVTIVIPGHGEPATTEQLKNQRLYLKDMLDQVRKGIKDGKTKEQLILEVDLSKHPVYGENKVSIKRSVGDMYDRLSK